MASSHYLRLRPTRRHTQIPSASPSSSPTSITSTSSTSSPSTSPSYCYFLPTSVLPRPASPTPPSLTRPEFNRASASSPSTSHTSATALLSRVARSRHSPPGTPVNEKAERLHEKDIGEAEAAGRGRRRNQAVMEEREMMGWGEAMKDWQCCDHGKRDGYVSFPDFEQHFDSLDATGEEQCQQQIAKS